LAYLAYLAYLALPDPPDLPDLIEREDEQVARVLELVEFHRVQMPPAGLHREVLLRVDRVGDRRAFQRCADVEAPELLERLVVVGDESAIL